MYKKSTGLQLDCAQTFTMNIVPIFRQLVLLIITYLATLTVILLLAGTIAIVSNGNILTDSRDKRKYLEKKYNGI